MNKGIFFDRDGTLIVDKYYINDVAQVEYLPGVFEALTRLKEAGYKFLVVTNQSGVPRGWVQEENLNAIHNKMIKDFLVYGISFESFYFAPHLPESNHPDRKPNCGMLTNGAKDYHINLSKSWMIGDKMSDVEAGHRAGCKTILIGHADDPADSQFNPPFAHVETLQSMADIILKNDTI